MERLSTHALRAERLANGEIMPVDLPVPASEIEPRAESSQLDNAIHQDRKLD